MPAAAPAPPRGSCTFHMYTHLFRIALLVGARVWEVCRAMKLMLFNSLAPSPYHHHPLFFFSAWVPPPDDFMYACTWNSFLHVLSAARCTARHRSACIIHLCMQFAFLPAARCTASPRSPSSSPAPPRGPAPAPQRGFQTLKLVDIPSVGVNASSWSGTKHSCRTDQHCSWLNNILNRASTPMNISRS